MLNRICCLIVVFGGPCLALLEGRCGVGDVKTAGYFAFPWFVTGAGRRSLSTFPLGVSDRLCSMIVTLSRHLYCFMIMLRHVHEIITHTLCYLTR